MVTNRGFQTIMGVGLEATWATAVPATHRIPYVSDALEAQYGNIPNQALVGQPARRKSQKGAQSVGGAFTSRLTYDVQQPMLQQFFGTFTPGDVGAPDHYDMAPVTDGSGMTLAINRVVSVHEYAGFKVNSLSFAGSAGEAVTYSCEGMAKTRLIADTENTDVTLAALDPEGGQVVYHEMSLWIGDLEDDLTALDAVFASTFGLTLNRNLQADEVNSPTFLEGYENDFRSGQLTFTLPRYSSDQFILWHEAHTTLQAIVSFTDGERILALHMPQLSIITNPVQQSGPGLATIPVTCDLYQNQDGANINTDMEFDEEIRVFESAVAV